MGNIVIILVLLVIIVLAVRSSMSHMKGEGGCCGGSSDKPEKKKLKGTKIAEKIIYIDGMHCQNCKNSVEKQINQIDGAVARVNLRKNIAVVSMDRIINDEDLRQAVERVDFKVTKIESKMNG